MESSSISANTEHPLSGSPPNPTTEAATVTRISRTSSMSKSIDNAVLNRWRTTSRGRDRTDSGAGRLRARMKTLRQRTQAPGQSRKDNSKEEQQLPNFSIETHRDVGLPAFDFKNHSNEKIDSILTERPADETTRDGSNQVYVDADLTERQVRLLHPVFQRINLPIDESHVKKRTEVNKIIENKEKTNSDTIDLPAYDDLYDPAPQTPRYTTKPNKIIELNNKALKSADLDSVQEINIVPNERSYFSNSHESPNPSSKRKQKSSENNQSNQEKEHHEIISDDSSGKALGNRSPFHPPRPIFIANNHIIPRPQIVSSFNFPTGHALPHFVNNPVLINHVDDYFNRSPLQLRPVPIPLSVRPPLVNPTPFVTSPRDFEFKHQDPFQHTQTPFKPQDPFQHTQTPPSVTFERDQESAKHSEFSDPLYRTMFQYDLGDDAASPDHLDDTNLSQDNEQHEDYDYKSIEDEVRENNGLKNIF